MISPGILRAVLRHWIFWGAEHGLFCSFALSKYTIIQQKLLLITYQYNTILVSTVLNLIVFASWIKKNPSWGLPLNSFTTSVSILSLKWKQKAKRFLMSLLCLTSHVFKILRRLIICIFYRNSLCLGEQGHVPDTLYKSGWFTGIAPSALGLLQQMLRASCWFITL